MMRSLTISDFLNFLKRWFILIIICGFLGFYATKYIPKSYTNKIVLNLSNVKYETNNECTNGLGYSSVFNLIEFNLKNKYFMDNIYTYVNDEINNSSGNQIPDQNYTQVLTGESDKKIELGNGKSISVPKIVEGIGLEENLKTRTMTIVYTSNDSINNKLLVKGIARGISNFISLYNYKTSVTIGKTSTTIINKYAIEYKVTFIIIGLLIGSSISAFLDIFLAKVVGGKR